ncbi:MAG: ROK family protein [Chloroflexota bacterium]
MLNTVVTVVDSLLAQAGIKRDHLLGVGVGVAGAVDPARGILRNNPFLAWRDLPLAELLEERLGVPVAIDNDVNTLTNNELWFGRGQGVSNFLVVTVGRGVGLGIVLNGQIYVGSQGGAGELGHTVIDPHGPLCECGKQGCLETYVSDPALWRMAQEAQARGELSATIHTPEDLLAAADAGDPAAQAIYAHAGDLLGTAVANLINILNPQLILVSGEGVRVGNHLFTPMRAAVGRCVMPGLAGDTIIEIDPWEDNGWARGAASLLLRRLFESPLHRDSVAATV